MRIQKERKHTNEDSMSVLKFKRQQFVQFFLCSFIVAKPTKLNALVPQYNISPDVNMHLHVVLHVIRVSFLTSIWIEVVLIN